MNRVDLIAAEVFGYSFDHYQDRIDIRNKRFTKYMPDDIILIEKSISKGKSNKDLAKALKISEEKVEQYKSKYFNAIKVVDSKNAGESYKEGLKITLENFIKRNKLNEQNIDELIQEILYRTTDFAYLLRKENKSISDYSHAFRHDDL